MNADDKELPPEHWENCAQEVRMLAESMVAPECRRILREIAIGYECMAQAARRFRRYGDTLIEGIIHPPSRVENAQP